MDQVFKGWVLGHGVMYVYMCSTCIYNPFLSLITDTGLKKRFLCHVQFQHYFVNLFDYKKR